MTEDGQYSPRRSSSQTSDASNKSNKAKRPTKPRKSPSTTSSFIPPKSDPSLTSFPSLPPDPALPGHPASPLAKSPPLPRTLSQKVRDRRTTLKGLTSASPPLTGQAALFDDSPRSLLEIPGALHLASDEHIERLITRMGALRIVRQFAQDLAQRDAEISAMRVRTEERERGLKQMLLEADVHSPEIEKKLLETHSSKRTVGSLGHDEGSDISQSRRYSTTTIDQMLHEALAEEAGRNVVGPVNNEVLDPAATIRPVKSDNEPQTRHPAGDSTKNGTLSGMDKQDHVWGNRTSSRVPSTTITEETEVADATAKARPSGSIFTRRKGLDNVFPPQNQGSSNSYFIGGTKTEHANPTSVPDDASIDSKRSSRSVASWTVRLFGGTSHLAKGTTEPKSPTTRTVSLAPSESGAGKTSATAAESAMAALAIKAAPNGSTKISKSPSSPTFTGTARGPNQVLRRPFPASTAAVDSPEPNKPSIQPKDLVPLEMDTILPSGSKPPIMTQTHNTYHTEGVLTDRFGFIYDQRQKGRRRETVSGAKKGHKLSSLESLGNFRTDSNLDGDSLLPTGTGERSGRVSPIPRSMTTAAIDDQVESGGAKKWQDYLKISTFTRPVELLLHTPSAAPVVTVNSADTTANVSSSSTRATSVSVGTEKVLPIASSSLEPNVSLATASNTESTVAQAEPKADRASQSPPSPASSPTTEQEPVKLLLGRLTELHDSLQAEKEAKWNDFLRRVRAERSSSMSTDRPTKVSNTPEADIVDGEVIGISTLGRPGKINRNKYTQFKSLVLQGIPVSLRPKIWSECSGASARRSPGYFDDLVSRSDDGRDLDQETVSQIQADIGRTLTDNTFFRHGPGVARLKMILLAYSLHNPGVGYCQGMNLITASLLLIMPTPEAAFWILVAIVENILPSGYFDRGLLVSRADQIVLREYVGEVLPKLGAHFQDLGVELEACTFMWFLSLFTGCLSAEALYRVWDVVLCLNSSDTPPGESTISGSIDSTAPPPSPSPSSSSFRPPPLPSSPTQPLPTTSTSTAAAAAPASPTAHATPPPSSSSPSSNPSQSQSQPPPPPSPITHTHSGSSSPFLFQLSLALLKLNEGQLLTLHSPAPVYSYINHNMTNHAISIDGLISAAEALRKVVRRDDVLARRTGAVRGVEGGG